VVEVLEEPAWHRETECFEGSFERGISSMLVNFDFVVRVGDLYRNQLCTEPKTRVLRCTYT